MSENTETEWATALQRLARKTDAAPPPAGHDRTAQIFAARAAALGVPDDAARPGNQLDLIAFDLGGQNIAIEARYIHAIVPPATPTPVPGVAETLAGVFNFRGDILPVFRLEHLLGGRTQSEVGCTVVLGEEQPEFAFFAQTADEVNDLSAIELITVPWQSGGSAPAALGISTDALNVLDGRALLSDPRFYIGHVAAGRLQGD